MMTLELAVLLVATLLVASLWIPYIIGVNVHAIPGADPFARPPDHSRFPDWVQRANRAHLNMVEQYVPFAVTIVIAHLLGATSAVLQVAAVAFVALRVLHAFGMIMGWARMPVRPLIFTSGYIAILIICIEIVRLSVS